MQDIII